MYNKSKNHQVIYSLDSLSNSLLKLLRTNNINDITITEICADANLSRKTFYRNCETIIDLVIYKIEKLIYILQDNTDWKSNDDHKLYTNFFNYWYNEKDFLIILKEQNLFHLFIHHFNVIIQSASYPFLDNVLENSENNENTKVFYNAFIVGGLSYVLQQWTNNNFQTSIKTLIDTMKIFVPNH